MEPATEPAAFGVGVAVGDQAEDVPLPQVVGDRLAAHLSAFGEGPDRLLFTSAAGRMGFNVTRADFLVRTDSQTAMWELAKAGLGISFAQAGLVRDAPGMVRLMPGFSPPPLEVWLTTHRELFTSRRIRAIHDRLGEGLTQYLARTLP